MISRKELEEVIDFFKIRAQILGEQINIREQIAVSVIKFILENGFPLKEEELREIIKNDDLVSKIIKKQKEEVIP